MVYNAFNLLLAFFGFALVLLGFVSGVGLLPLMCLGHLVLKLLILVIRILDVKSADTLPCNQWHWLCIQISTIDSPCRN